jgi:hypothetical protein
MKQKILSTVVAVVLFTATTFASPLFPNAFQAPVSGGKNCSVPSDIVSGFCAASGAGSFQAAVQSCAPGHLSMQAIYLGMVAAYGGSNHTLAVACQKTAKQYGGTVQGCIGQWTCYSNGGASKDMSGLCNGNGQACATL